MSASTSGGSDDNDVPRVRRVRAVTLLAGILTVAGIVGSVLAAQSAADHADQRAQQFVERTAIEVSASLRLAIQREQDLVVSAAGFFLAEPNVDDRAFAVWSSSTRAMDRNPELLGWAKVVLVPAADLDAFILRQGGISGSGAPFDIVPAGDRPYYCLAAVSQNREGLPAAPAGFDFCAATSQAIPLEELDPGSGGYTVVNTGSGDTLAVQVPFYRGGAVPTTPAARRREFVGWTGLGFDPQTLLATARLGRDVNSVEVRYHDADSDVAFSSGSSSPSMQSIVIDIGDGWAVETFFDNAPGGIASNAAALALLISGMIAALLIGSLVVFLGTARARALRMVTQRTGELQHLAVHDMLTGLPNRALIMDRLNQLLARGRRNGTTGAVLFVDLDDFKSVNDTLGHQAGDQLLIAVSSRLTSTLRNVDTIGRMGGDEFVVLIDGSNVNAAPELVAERLLDVMRQPFHLDASSSSIVVNTSIGIAVGRDGSADDLLRNADIALYEAKALGKNRFEVFLPEMQTHLSRRIELEHDLRDAAQRSEFRLAYQPIYTLDDLGLVAVEALLRWDHPVLGNIEPTEFIPLLEHSGQIIDVGRWVLREACHQMARWHTQGDHLDMSVNISGRQLEHDSIIGHIREALQLSGLEPSSLIIEVTETTLMLNPSGIADRLRAIRDLGVRIAVDDFGSGYSSLTYLQQIPVDCLKIDRCFTDAITASSESHALIGALVQLGRDLGLTTLAEGVETPEQMDHLRSENVDQVQGFLMSRPMDPITFERQLLLTSHIPSMRTGRQPEASSPAT